MKNLALITGIPRSGTTLVTKLLNEIPDVVALNEPMEVKQLAGKSNDEIFSWIDARVEEYRSGLISNGKVMTKFVGQRFVDNSFDDSLNARGLRPSQAVRGLIHVDKKLTENFLLAMKHNGAFAAVLRQLASRYTCFAIIRNPLSVLLSWQTVDIPVNRGRLPVAEAIDGDLREHLNRISDRLVRQIHIINWFFERFRKFVDANQVLRYEDLVKDAGASLAKIAPAARWIHQPLQSQNSSARYSKELVPQIVERLQSAGGSYLHFYSMQEIEALGNSMVSYPEQDDI